MDAKQFSKMMVKLMRQGFPELYVRHVRGRRREFLEEHAPQLDKSDEQGEVLGRVSQDAQMLWALAEVLYQAGPKRWPRHSKQGTLVETCQDMRGINVQSFCQSMELGFWEYVMQKFENKVYPRTRTLRVNHDWSVSLIEMKDTSRSTKLYTKFSRLAVIAEVTAATHWQLGNVLNSLKHYKK